MYCNGQLKCLFHMALTLSGLHSPFPVRWSHFGSVMMAGNNVRRRWSPRGSIRFQLFPLNCCPTADQGTLAQLGLHPYIVNRHISIYEADSVQGFRKAEKMVGREQMPHIKVSRDCFHASKGRGGFFYLHQLTCFQLSQFWGASTKLPSAQSEGRVLRAAQPSEWHFRALTTLPNPRMYFPSLLRLPGVFPSSVLPGRSAFLSRHWMEMIETFLKTFPLAHPFSFSIKQFCSFQGGVHKNGLVWT